MEIIFNNIYNFNKIIKIKRSIATPLYGIIEKNLWNSDILQAWMVKLFGAVVASTFKVFGFTPETNPRDYVVDQVH